MRKLKPGSDVPACGHCGSTALHSVAYGMPSPELLDESARRPDLRLGGCCISPEDWSRECLSCGQRQYFDDGRRSEWATVTKSDTAAVVTRYAELVRDQLNTATAPAVSYAGLWLLLAHLAPVACGPHRAALAEAIGISCEQAAALAGDLLEAPHPTLATALGAWSRVPLDAKLAVPLEAMPDQADLDRWAAEHTRGLIKQFPLAVDPLTALIFATALVLEPRWSKTLWSDHAGMLVLDGGLQTIVDTEAAGLVAVAKPFSADGIDVVSVIAAADVAPREVWRATDEVVARLNEGALWHGECPAGLADGHAWTVRAVTEEFRAWDAPAHNDVLWRSHLPKWQRDMKSDLTGAPGVADIIGSLVETVPALAELPVKAQCVQAATASYDESGFRAAAVTAMGVYLTGAPQFVTRTVRRVEVTFDRPHAVIAIARGGPWEGVPVFNAWVTPR